ncbi:MAG: hypothetical protein ACYTGJ_04115 [Planctomycetota bacterium]|jgi:hypothetical protein
MKLQTLACVLFLSSVPMVATAQPLNDQCLNATPVGEGTFPWDNTGTLVDGPIDCDLDMSEDVWFLYTASSTGHEVLDRGAASR